MKKLCFISIALSSLFLMGCEEELRNAIEESLLPENIKFSDGTYISNCFSVEEGVWADIETVISEEGQKRSYTMRAYTDSNCIDSNGYEESESDLEIDYTLIEIKEGMSIIRSTKKDPEDENSFDKYQAYFIDSDTGKVYLSKESTEELSAIETQAESYFTSFIEDPLQNYEFVFNPM